LNTIHLRWSWSDKGDQVEAPGDAQRLDHSLSRSNFAYPNGDSPASNPSETSSATCQKTALSS
jgi:hypothetical protein